MKKLLSYLLVIALVLVQFMPLVNAASGKNDNSGKITITNAVGGQTYKVYQVLELESYDTESGAYTYVVQGTAEDVKNSWYYFLNEGAGKEYVNLTASNDGKYVVTWKLAEGETEPSADDVKAFSLAAIEFAKDNNIEATQTKETAGAPTDGATYTVEFTGLNLGYYLVDSSLGLLCNLTTTNPTIEITAKNNVPTVDKEVKEDSTGLYGDKNHDDIGKRVYYKTTINAQNGAENYVLYDKMDAGLTLDKNSIVVTLDSTTDKTLVEDKDYTVSFNTTGYTFVIDFVKSLEDTLVTGDKIVVTYEALINEDAVVGEKGNKNETHLEYGDDNESNYDSTITYTFDFDLVKENAEGTQLSGAEFELYRSATGTEDKIALVFDTDRNAYRVATDAEKNAEGFVSEKIVVGSATIIGLDSETTYYLDEVVAPDGYNQLTSRVPVTVSAAIFNQDDTVTLEFTSTSNVVDITGNEVTVINTTGSLLPSTGGMGTVLFITVGSIMVLGFGVLLVTKLRISKMEI